MNDNNDVPAGTTTEVQQLDSGNSSTNNSNNNVLFDEANDKYENEFKSQMTRHSPSGGVGEWLPGIIIYEWIKRAHNKSKKHSSVWQQL